MRRTIITLVSTMALLATGVVAGVALSGTGTVAPPPRIAFLANGINPADAVAGGAIAGQLGAPIFTTNPGVLEDAARTGMVAYAPDLIIVLGGPVAIADAVLVSLSDATGLSIVAASTTNPRAGITRVAGDTRYDTAAAVAKLVAAYAPAYLPVDATALGAVDADTLDGLDATAFEPAGDFALADQACSAGKIANGVDGDGTLLCTNDKVNGGNAATLGGLGTAAFQPAGDYALAGHDHMVVTSGYVEVTAAANATTVIHTLEFTLDDECPGVPDGHNLLVMTTGHTSEGDGLSEDIAMTLDGNEIAREPYTHPNLGGLNNRTFAQTTVATAVDSGVHTVNVEVSNFAADSTGHGVEIVVEALGWTCNPPPVRRTIPNARRDVADVESGS